MAKKRILPLLTLFASLVLGSFAFIHNAEYQENKAAKQVDSDIYSVQVRSDNGNNYFIVILDRAISTTAGATVIYDYDNYTALDHVKVYTSPTDSVFLSDIVAETVMTRAEPPEEIPVGWNINYWGCQGILFPMDKATFQNYNALSVYAIEILEGCTYPNNKSETIMVSSSKTYINKKYDLNRYHELFPAPYAHNVDLPAESLEAFDWYEVTPFDETSGGNITLNNAQIRASRADNLFYIDIMSNLYSSALKEEYYALERTNAYSFIKLYLSEDGEPVPLGEATTLRNGLHNQFDNVPAMFFALTKDEFDIYNGATVYKIEVQKGCQFLVNGVIYTTNKTYIFKNNTYNPSALVIDEVFEFEMSVLELDNFGQLSVIGIQNRMDRDTQQRWLTFLFEERAFDNFKNAYAFVDKTNFFDHVLIYRSKDAEPITLGSIYGDNDSDFFPGVSLRIFNEDNLIGVSINNPKDADNKYINDTGHMYMIEIQEGTEFPAYENDTPGYRVIAHRTVIINSDYGKTGYIYSEWDPERGTYRLYEEWGVHWSIVSCVASFTVVGIEGLHFDNMNLVVGQCVELSYFAQEGYDLVVTTSEGEKVYTCIIGANRDINYILTYSVHQDGPITPVPPEEKTPAEPNYYLISILIGAGSAIVLLGVFVPVMIVLTKKRRGISK